MLLPAHGHWQLCQSVLPFYVLGYFASAYRGALQGWRRWLPHLGLAAGVGVVVAVLGFWSREAYVYITGVRWTGPDARWTLLRFGVGAWAVWPSSACGHGLFSRIPARLAQGLAGWGRPACAPMCCKPALQRHDLGGPHAADAGPGRCAQLGGGSGAGLRHPGAVHLGGLGLAQSPWWQACCSGTLKGPKGARSASVQAQ